MSGLRIRPIAVVAVIGVAAAMALAGCSSNSASSSKTITFAYQQVAPATVQTKVFTKAKAEFEKQNPGATLKLMPINAQEDDFKSKIELLQSNASTAPDVVFEDGSRINSSAAAKYIEPIDSYVAKWSDWKQYPKSAQEGGQAVDGKQYMVPLTTDTRGIWYNKAVFAQAGLPTDWQPKSWDDLLDAARTIKAKVPGVVPMNLFSSKAIQEGTTMQGMDMLLSGTKDGLDGTQYDSKAKKWVVDSSGFVDALKFYDTVRTEGLGPDQSDLLASSLGNTVANTWLPQNKLGFTVDGNWMYATWTDSGTTPWKDWSTTMGWTAMPTQNGQGDGTTSMSGSNGLMISSKSGNKDLAFKAIQILANQDNTLAYDQAVGVLPPRSDVASSDAYTSSNPTAKFFADLASVTHYRPTLEVYPQISVAIQTATEAVSTGASTPAEASKKYGESVTQIVGSGETKKG
jgi:multiple sugar transport system substrate-binding protein